MLTPFQRVCAQILGLPPLAVTGEEVDARMQTEVIRYKMEAGVFRFNKPLLDAYHTGDAGKFAAAAGITIPAEPISLLTLDAKLDLLLQRIPA